MEYSTEVIQQTAHKKTGPPLNATLPTHSVTEISEISVITKPFVHQKLLEGVGSTLWNRTIVDIVGHEHESCAIFMCIHEHNPEYNSCIGPCETRL